MWHHNLWKNTSLLRTCEQAESATANNTELNANTPYLSALYCVVGFFFLMLIMSSALKTRRKKMTFKCFRSSRWTSHTWVVRSLRNSGVEQNPDNCTARCFCCVWDTVHSFFFLFDMNNGVMTAYHWLRTRCTLWLELIYMPEPVFELQW